MCKLEYSACMCVCGGGNQFCWEKRIKLENARTLHLCKALVTPKKCHKLPAKSLSPRLLVFCSTSPWEHLILANFSLLYDQILPFFRIFLEILDQCLLNYYPFRVLNIPQMASLKPFKHLMDYILPSFYQNVE